MANEGDSKSVISPILGGVSGDRLAGLRNAFLHGRWAHAWGHKCRLPLNETGGCQAEDRNHSLHSVSFKEQEKWPTESVSSATQVITGPGRSRQVVRSILPVQARCACCFARCWPAAHRGRSC